MTLRMVRGLPVTWDGVPVQWGELGRTGGSLDLHLPLRCELCGSTAPPWRAGGTLLLERDPHTGRRPRPLALHVERCTECLHDVVYNVRTGESWDLDASDYGVAGSSAEGVLW